VLIVACSGWSNTALMLGEELELRLRSPFEGRRKFKGILRGIEGEDVVLLVDDHEYLLPYGNVDRAQLMLRI
jgi:ribosome maturation factor RimP